MSNIIDGIDYGMGYEQATKWEPGLQYLDPALRVWQKSGNGENFGLTSGITYRRPLPIISQHPGAIPLEPGEELRVGERYLTRASAVVSVFCSVKHPFLKYGTEDDEMVWSESGRFAKSALSMNDIIARLPKEEKVESEWVTADHPKHGKISQRIDIAAVFAQLPQVIAEVERQRKEKEIKVGDWYVHNKTSYDKCKEALNGMVCGEGLNCNLDARDCTKIHDPAFIALLENGGGNG